MTSYEDKAFRSEKEAAREPAEVFIRMGHPQVRAIVAPLSGTSGELTRGDFVTSFCVSWQPNPTPPASWVELLRKSPFGTQTVRARDLRWDGHYFKVELIHESDIEEFAAEMPDWVAFANAEYGRRSRHTPAEEVLAEAAKRAAALENRLRR
jgi:hypothetical protein